MQSSARKILQMEFKKLHDQPVEGFTIGLVDDSDMFQWKVALFGPPDTLYAGGYFRALMKFPMDYPYGPPSFRFITKMFHSNIYENGEVCISILHSPGNDEQSGEHASERWNPTQTVRTILLSVVSLLNEPNTSSPANVDASVMYRKWKDSDGKENEYEQIIKKQVEESKKDAARDGVIVPETISEYCIQTELPSKCTQQQEDNCSHIGDLDDFYDSSDTDEDDDDDYYDDVDDDDDSGTHEHTS